MFSTLLPLVHLVRKYLATPHLSLSVMTSLLCTLNLVLKLSLNAEPTYCSLHSLQLIRKITVELVQHNYSLTLYVLPVTVHVNSFLQTK